MAPATTIGTVRLHNVGGYDVAHRLRMETRLSNLDLSPAAMPPSAILIVRSLRSPLPAAESSRGWTQPRDQVDALYRGAVRPLRQADLNADAVVFESEAELLACFALDVLRHTATSHWWWRHAGLARGTSANIQLASLMAEHIRALPSALHLLAGLGSLTDVMRLLQPVHAGHLLARLQREFGLNEPAHVTVPATQAAPREGAADAGLTQAPQAPWTAWLPRSRASASLPPESQLLAGTALGLVRAPAAVRSESYAGQAQAWLAFIQAPARPALQPEASAPGPASERRKPPITIGAPSHESGSESRIGRRAPVPEENGSRADTAADESALDPQARREVPLSGDSPTSSDASALGSLEQAESATTLAPAGEPVTPSTPASAEMPVQSEQLAEAPPATGAKSQNGPAPEATRPPTTHGDGQTETSSFLDTGPVRTSLAGVLFLINLMLYVDLPAAPGVDLELEETLGHWGTLEALAIGLLDTLPEAAASWPRWRRDGLWSQLALLSGRDRGQRLGDGLGRPHRFELPAAWTERDESTLLQATDGIRLRRWSSAGYLLSEGPLALPSSQNSPPPSSERGGRQRGSGGRPYDEAPLHRLKPAATRRLSPGLRYWLARVLPYLRLRLAGALGADATEADAALRELLLRDGRLYVSSTHLDLVMRLGDVSVAARIAGLDRDPGWQPRFGRVIKFHYE